jgi:hypothetical protein
MNIRRSGSLPAASGPSGPVRARLEAALDRAWGSPHLRNLAGGLASREGLDRAVLDRETGLRRAFAAEALRAVAMDGRFRPHDALLSMAARAHLRVMLQDIDPEVLAQIVGPVPAHQPQRPPEQRVRAALASEAQCLHLDEPAGAAPHFAVRWLAQQKRRVAPLALAASAALGVGAPLMITQPYHEQYGNASLSAELVGRVSAEGIPMAARFEVGETDSVHLRPDRPTECELRFVPGFNPAHRALRELSGWNDATVHEVRLRAAAATCVLLVSFQGTSRYAPLGAPPWQDLVPLAMALQQMAAEGRLPMPRLDLVEKLTDDREGREFLDDILLRAALAQQSLRYPRALNCGEGQPTQPDDLTTMLQRVAAASARARDRDLDRPFVIRLGDRHEVTVNETAAPLQRHAP